MQSKSDLEQGRALTGYKPTIREVLGEYLQAEKNRLSPKTYARYSSVIELFAHSIDGYAANSLNQFERARFDKYIDAEGDQNRKFCDIFGPEHILDNVGEFLNYFMVRKVVVGPDILGAAGTVMKKLATWLVEQGYAKLDDAILAIEQGSAAVRDLPAAEKLSTVLYDLTIGRYEPRDSDIEGNFSITRLEPGKIWLQDEEDGKSYGPILLPDPVTKLCRKGWVISGAIRDSGRTCLLIEAFQVCA
jgi:hypothetical protein